MITEQCSKLSIRCAFFITKKFNQTTNNMIHFILLTCQTIKSSQTRPLVKRVEPSFLKKIPNQKELPSEQLFFFRQNGFV